MIGIIILNYINWEDTFRCVQSILNSKIDIDYKVYVVDNASPNTCEEKINKMFRELDKKIKVIYNKTNNGYSSGNNIGIKHALIDGCEEILVANNDVIFKKDSIQNMYVFLMENDDVGIVGPKIYTSSGEVQEINMGIKMDLKGKYLNILDKTCLSLVSKNFMGKFRIRDTSLQNPFQVFAVSGCCFMINKECVKKITPFDENTFLYEEENIIGHRMENIGYKTFYNTHSEIIHLHGQSTENIKAFAYLCFVESEIYYCKKYLNKNIIMIAPLYLIRTLKYCVEMIRSNDYRKNSMLYFKKTIRAILCCTNK